MYYIMELSTRILHADIEAMSDVTVSDAGDSWLDVNWGPLLCGYGGVEGLVTSYDIVCAPQSGQQRTVHQYTASGQVDMKVQVHVDI